MLLSSGTVSKLWVFLNNSPGGGNSYTFTVRRDPAGTGAGKEPSNTTIACTISGSATSCEDTSHSQKFEAGDAVSISATESNSPSTRNMFFRLEFQPS